MHIARKLLGLPISILYVKSQFYRWFSNDWEETKFRLNIQGVVFPKDLENYSTYLLLFPIVDF